ncbi:MAK10-like protein [Tanacetum coccineum]
MASHDARLSKFEADFKQQQSEVTNKIDTLLKVINDRMKGLLPSDTVKNLKLNVNSTSSVSKNGSAYVQNEIPKKLKDPKLFTLPCRLEDSKPFDTLANLGSCVNLIPLFLYKKLKFGLLVEIESVLGLADVTNAYPVGVVRDIEVHIGRGFLETASVIIDYKKSKIVVGEGYTRLVFRVKEIEHGEEEVLYWTTQARRSSYGLGRNTNIIDPQNPFYLENDFINTNAPGEWELARDAEINPFKDVLVFRKVIEFIGAIPINLKGNK